MNDQNFKILLSAINEVKQTVNDIDNKLDAVTIETNRQDVKIQALEADMKNRVAIINGILVTIVGSVAASFIVSQNKTEIKEVTYQQKRPPLVMEVKANNLMLALGSDNHWHN